MNTKKANATQVSKVSYKTLNNSFTSFKQPINKDSSNSDTAGDIEERMSAHYVACRQLRTSPPLQCKIRTPPPIAIGAAEKGTGQ